MVENKEIKEQVKEALFEFFSRDNNYLREVITDLMEDIAMGEAIKEGDVGDYVDENEILSVLKKDT